MLSYAPSIVQGANSFHPSFYSSRVVCMNCSAFVNSHHSPLFDDAMPFYDQEEIGTREGPPLDVNTENVIPFKCTFIRLPRT